MTELLGTPSLWSVVSGTSPIPATAGAAFNFVDAASITANAADGDTVEFDCSFDASTVEGAILTISNALNTALTLGAADTPPVHVLVPLSAGPVRISLAWPAGSPNAGEPINVTLTPGAGSGDSGGDGGDGGGGGGPVFTSPFSLGACTVRVLPPVDQLPGGDDGSEVADYDDTAPIWEGPLGPGEASDQFTVGSLPCHIAVAAADGQGLCNVSLVSDADMVYSETNPALPVSICLDVLRPQSLGIGDFYGADFLSCLFEGLDAFVTDMQSGVTELQWNAAGADTDTTPTVAGTTDTGGSWRITNGLSGSGNPYANNTVPVQPAGTAILGFRPYITSTAVSPPPPPPPPPPPLPPPADCDEIGPVTVVRVSAYQRARTHRATVYRGEQRCLVFDYNGAISQSRTITGVTLRCDQPYAAALSGLAIQTDNRSVRVTLLAQWGGGSMIKCEATLDNGEIYPAMIEICVRERPWFQGQPNPVAGPYTLTV